MDSASGRHTHVVLDGESRAWKARKIEAMLGPARIGRCRRMLEVGAGSGLISKYFAARLAPAGRMSAVDVVDSRVDRDGYDFTLVQGTRLPYPDGEFDIVVTNHVIEHVGDRDEQRRHLDEISRVLKPDGVVYFAVPNRWSLWEAHFRLPLLGWLPQRLADGYVRLFRRGADYDCKPLSRSDALGLFASAGFDYRDRTFDALSETMRIEHGGKLAGRWADTALFRLAYRLARPIIPTLIFELDRPAATAPRDSDRSSAPPTSITDPT